MSFDNHSFYDDDPTNNWSVQQPTPMEDRRRKHTGRRIALILILAVAAAAVLGAVHLVRDVGVSLNRSDSGFLLTIGRPAVQTPAEAAEPAEEAAAQTPQPAQTQPQQELPVLEIDA